MDVFRYAPSGNFVKTCLRMYTHMVRAQARTMVLGFGAFQGQRGFTSFSARLAANSGDRSLSYDPPWAQGLGSV